MQAIIIELNARSRLPKVIHVSAICAFGLMLIVYEVSITAKYQDYQKRLSILCRTIEWLFDCF